MSPLQAKVVEHILSGPLGATECSVRSFQNEDGPIHRQGIIDVDDADGVKVIFSLPQAGESRIFVTASDGDEYFVRRVIANLEEASVTQSIKPGHVLLLRDPEISRRDIDGVMFLPIGVSDLLDYLPERFSFAGKEYLFLLVVFLTSQEHELWRKQGHDALMDHWQEIGKDLVGMPPEKY